MQPQPQLVFLPLHIRQVHFQRLDLPLLFRSSHNSFHATAEVLLRHQLRHLMDAALNVRASLAEIRDLGFETGDEVDGMFFSRCFGEGFGGIALLWRCGEAGGHVEEDGGGGDGFTCCGFVRVDGADLGPATLEDWGQFFGRCGHRWWVV